MKWDRPELIEVNMSAEIGAYQDDSGERDESPLARAGESEPSDAPLGCVK
jgi:hypothetical protein